MQLIDLIMPTLKKPHAWDAMQSLRHLPFPVRPHFISDGSNWAQAVNIGLWESTGDVLLMDDDVTIQPDTFAELGRYFDRADIFGFLLRFPDGRIQHAGGFYSGGSVSHLGYCSTDISPYQAARRVCHCTASLLYIKRAVVDRLERFHEFSGVQFEDVDFSFRALKEGFRIVCLPGEATHHESQTKKEDADFARRMNVSYRELFLKHLLNREFTKKLEEYPIAI